jgi:hypothetical protein
VSADDGPQPREHVPRDTLGGLRDPNYLVREDPSLDHPENVQFSAPALLSKIPGVHCKSIADTARNNSAVRRSHGWPGEPGEEASPSHRFERAVITIACGLQLLLYSHSKAI